jgi:hypothetical protein
MKGRYKIQMLNRYIVLWCATVIFGCMVCDAQTPTYATNITATADWTVSSASSLPDGAILYTSTEIEPYFANLAAIGLTKKPATYPQVKAWMEWYISHLNYPDQWGLYCTVYDYSVSGTTETSMNSADSTDSYAATFLSLAWAYWQTGDPTAQAYIKTLSYQLNCVGNVITETQQSNGLTWALPNYQIQYLMDNSEVYNGVTALSNLEHYAFNDTYGQSYYAGIASQVKTGIQTDLWDSTSNSYYPYVGSTAANWSTWYPDSTAQLYPIINGVIAPSSTRAINLYAKFNSSWPNWDTLNFPDPFPWAVVSGASALMGDTTRTNTYINKIQSTYVNVSPAFPYPWYDQESGWFIRANNYMLGNRPL